MTTPLPPLPEPYQEALTPFWAYTAGQMRTYATAARADLDAEVKRLREALQLAHGHIDMGALRVSHCKDAATITAALENKP